MADNIINFIIPFLIDQIADDDDDCMAVNMLKAQLDNGMLVYFLIRRLISILVVNFKTFPRTYLMFTNILFPEFERKGKNVMDFLKELSRRCSPTLSEVFFVCLEEQQTFCANTLEDVGS